VHYSCHEMDDESVKRVRKIIEAANVGKLHLARGDLL